MSQSNFPATANKQGNKKGILRLILKLSGFLSGAALFFYSLAQTAYMFFLIQILNSYPFWDYSSGYRLQLAPFEAVYGDLKYAPPPFHFLKYTQLFDLFIALAFVGLFLAQLSIANKITKKSTISALGFTALVGGIICSVIVFLETEVLTGQNLPWGSYSWGSERVSYNTQFLGTEYNCLFLNYTELLIIAAFMAVIGFLLWNHYGANKPKSPPTWTVAVLFAASLATVIVGSLLMFPNVEFSSSVPNSSIPATPYAVQGTFLVWGGAILLMLSFVCLGLKLRQKFPNRPLRFRHR